MFSMLNSLGIEIPFTLLLLALLGLRRRVSPRASILINASPEKVFGTIDVYDGRFDTWGRTTILAKLIDAATQTFRKTYTTTLTTGVAKSSEALFRIARREANNNLVLVREGLAGRSTNSELLELTFDIAEEGDKTRLTMAYHWGPRPLLAQITSRADLWGGIYRLKGLAETGHPNEHPYQLISAGVALVTGLVTLAAFSVFFGFAASILIVIALFAHEFGHLLAYRLMGQPWGRMVFLPFLGAVALPRLAFDSQGQSVFAALMGPGFSVLLAFVCALPPLIGLGLSPYLCTLGLVTAAINLFNLLPAEPLDGGVALRSVVSRLLGSHARFGLLIVGAVVVAAGFIFSQIILVIFGGIAILANLKPRTIDEGLSRLTSLQVSITVFAFTTITAAHVTFLWFFLDYLGLLKSIAG